MVRLLDRLPMWLVRSPHTRGDGPAFQVFVDIRPTFSPHAWGWSGYVSGATDEFSVLPTRVGMVRLKMAGDFLAVSSPHTRGDGPHKASKLDAFAEFSPHAWGWSGKTRGVELIREVLPTRVGMVRYGARRRAAK